MCIRSSVGNTLNWVDWSCNPGSLWSLFRASVLLVSVSINCRSKKKLLFIYNCCLLIYCKSCRFILWVYFFNALGITYDKPLRVLLGATVIPLKINKEWVLHTVINRWSNHLEKGQTHLSKGDEIELDNKLSTKSPTSTNNFKGCSARKKVRNPMKSRVYTRSSRKLG